jgi:5-methylcytosine-specific restriction protein B
VLARDDVLVLSQDALVREVRATYELLFPLVLVAMLDEPLMAIGDYLGDEDDAPERHPSHPLTVVEHETGIKAGELQRWVDAINRKKQAILYGPPGTGKTFLARHLAQHLVGGGTGECELVQFHPAYAYEDFIQGLRPEATGEGGLRYVLRAGRFLEFCQRARGREGLSVLIIDEINRANLARVFGELMYLLEYRDSEVPLAGGGVLQIPENVRIIGTMNTADRSIALVDHALRRRFAFIQLQPQLSTLEHYHGAGNPLAVALVKLLHQVNEAIDNPYYEVGVSFFLQANLAEHIESIWRMEIEPYLEEYFYNQQGQAEQFRWDSVKAQLGLE